MQRSTKPARNKSFLDSSVLRFLLMGVGKYRQYFRTALGAGPHYISRYVLMEFRRSFVRSVLSFYFILENPEIKTIGDAITHWSQRYQTSELKAVLQLIGQLVNAHALDGASPRDKQKLMGEIAVYLKRLEMKLRRQFRNTGIDSTRCERAMSPDDRSSDLHRAFEQFCRDFDDVNYCRSRCTVDRFLLKNRRSTVEQYVDISNKSRHRGFVNIADDLKEILAEGASACSCKRCEAIGDAVIVLDCPREMVLEHVDASFNDLCPLIHQQHRYHPSETAVLRHVERHGALPPVPPIASKD